MEIIYKQVESTEKPHTIQTTYKYVYIRKDISRIKKVINGEDVYYWRYSEAKLTHQEFIRYSENITAENAIKGINDSDNISNILAGQTTNDENMLTIMEAIADLYAMIASIGG